MKTIFSCLVISLAILSGRAAAFAQECRPPAIVANANAKTIFSPEQEMILGDLTLESMSGEFKLLADEKLEAYVAALGEKLVRHLPPTGLVYRFHVIDYPEANAFNIPGGHVFISRKLIAFVANEDELAGVIAHELGHATVRHAAVDTSYMMRQLLNVTSVGDRRDIAEKFNRLIENSRTKRVSQRAGHGNDQQLEADRIGLHAMVAAGYNPAAFAAFFDRLADTEGRTGSWLDALFGTTRPDEKRLRDMIKLTQEMPAACRDRAPSGCDEFRRWQADVVLFRDAGRREVLPGLVSRRELAPKMRGDVTRLDFSPDGRYLVVRDDFGLSVMTREPFAVAFAITAEGVRDFSFTGPDELVLMTDALRFERWDLATRRPVEVRELVTASECWESRLSPDGRYLVCIGGDSNVDVIETKTGERKFRQKDFVQVTYIEYMFSLGGDGRGGNDPTGFYRIEFSPDSKFVLLGRSDRYRYSLVYGGLGMDETDDQALGIDLTALKAVGVDGTLKKIVARPFVFVDSQRIVGMPNRNPGDGGIFTFPNGKRLQKFEYGARFVKLPTNHDYLVIKPINNARMGVFDLRRGIIVSGLNKEDAALWGDFAAYESVGGTIILFRLEYSEADKRLVPTEIGRAELPAQSLGKLTAAGLSDDFQWLAISSKTRGGVWKLDTGERKMFVRGFDGAIVAGSGATVAEFKRFADTPHTMALLNPSTGAIDPFLELKSRLMKQYGRFLLTRRPLVEKTPDGKPAAPAALTLTDDDQPLPEVRRAARYEVLDVVKNNVIWSRDFPKDAPEFSFDEYSGRMILYWSFALDSTREKLKEFPQLGPRAAALGSRRDDYLVEVVDAFEKKTVGAMLLETGNGSFDVGAGLSERDWLMLYDSEGRVLVYSLASGELRHRFFGRNAALNPVRDMIAVENFPGELSLYDLRDGARTASVKIRGDVAFARFNLAGNRLFVLSDEQTAYTFDLVKIAAAAGVK